jgi:hypothetical protein
VAYTTRGCKPHVSDPSQSSRINKEEKTSHVENVVHGFLSRPSTDGQSKSITAAPDFGSSLTLAAYSTEIDAFSAKLDSYNQMVAALDDLQIQLDTAEGKLHETNRRWLAATQAHYGPDSSEYEQAGGTRVSDRKRPTKKTPAKPAS